MGRKGSECFQHENDHDHEQDFQEDEVPIEEQVQEKIKGLTSLAQKVQVIALNSFLIQKRALDKQLEAQHTKIEVKHRKTYEPLLQQIANIASGLVDLTDDDLEGVEHLLTEQEKQVKKNYYPKKPIEEYWLKAFISSDAIGQSVNPDDQNSLKHLIKIQASKTEDGSNLTVIFHFGENQWFSNQTIKKQFEVSGDQIKRSYGDVINWKQGKNLTVQVIKKKNKKKKTTVTKQVEKESFFNLFKQIDLTSDNQQEQNDDVKKQEQDEQSGEVQKLQRQYQICNAIYEQILPRSLEYYLGVVGAMDFDDLAQIGEGDQQDQEEEQQTSKGKKKSKSNKRKGSHSSKE